MIRLELANLADSDGLFSMAVEYFCELMPHSDVVANSNNRERYFQSEFFSGGKHVFWAVEEGRRIGFVVYGFDEEKRSAKIHHFYVGPKSRRAGAGSEMMIAVFRDLDSKGIEQIDLNVRRDNPAALAFWESVGFGIAGYRLRMFRDPENGTAYSGSLSSDFVDTDHAD